LADRQASQWIWGGRYKGEMAEQKLKRNLDTVKDSILMPGQFGVMKREEHK